MTVHRAPWPALVVILLSIAAIALRIEAASRPGLWADEIFSLAMATGHSLEHPAAEADSALGDFVQPREAQSPEAFRRYAERDAPPAGAGRVIRAVLLSDTSPPLYYLLLGGWVAGFGSGDAALRLFSVFWAALSLPLLWLLGRELGGDRVAGSACLLFAISPVAFFYSVEGRMYSQLWFLALALGWLTVRLAEGGSPIREALWVLVGVAGLLTHYFFAFIWVACLAWLCLYRPTPHRRRVVVLAAVTLIAVLPWYLEVPASLARWRVTGGWLNGELSWRHALGRPMALAGSLLSGSSLLGGWRRADRLVSALFLALALWMVYRRSARAMLSTRSALLIGWVAAACTGPVVFDLLRHTTASDVPRYALAGLPAALLLVALAMSQLPPKVHLVFLALVLIAWFPGAWATVVATTPRPWEPYPEVAARLDAWAEPGDVVVVRSVPSGIVGVARYMTRDTPLVSWVAALGTREAQADLEPLLRDHRRLAVATIHNRGAPDQLEPWLRAHARVSGRTTFRSSSAEVLYFESSSSIMLSR